VILPSTQAEVILRSLKQIALQHGDLAATPRSLLNAVQKYFLFTQIDLDQLASIAPEAVAEVIQSPSMRLQLIQAMVGMILSTGSVTTQQWQAIVAYAQVLNVPQSTLRNLRQLYQRQLRWLKFDVYRRCFIAQKYQFELRRQGIGWLVRGLVSYLGWMDDRSLADRYHQLQHFPPETLGYQFWQFYQENHYAFPGERHGNHESTCFHDVTHILAGHDTSPEGELQVVGMTIGYKTSGDPLASLFFILLQQHLGIQVGLLSKASLGVLDRPGMAEKFVRSLKCGAVMTIDLAENWDHWTAFEQSVSSLRQQYNITNLAAPETKLFTLDSA
jgi:hypothetical protein